LSSGDEAETRKINVNYKKKADGNNVLPFRKYDTDVILLLACLFRHRHVV
jgi:hypothetical protein